MSEFEKWRNSLPDGFPGSREANAKAAWNAAPEAAANDIMENSQLEWPENIGVAAAIRALKEAE